MKNSAVVTGLIDWGGSKNKYQDLVFILTVFTVFRFLVHWMCKKTWCLLLLQVNRACEHYKCNKIGMITLRCTFCFFKKVRALSTFSSMWILILPLDGLGCKQRRCIENSVNYQTHQDKYISLFSNGIENNAKEN